MECAVISQRYLRGFTAAEKTELWDRWQRGESLKAIGRVFGKPSSSIYFQLAPHGGFAIGSRSGSVTVAVQGSGGELANAQTARQSVGGGEAKLVRRTEVSALAGKKVLGV
jgi:IS30 family transposase